MFIKKLSIALLAVSLSIGAAIASHAQETLVIDNSNWSTTGVKTSNSKFTSFFQRNGPKTFALPSVVVFGNAVTSGALSGTGSFSAVPVQLIFDLSKGLVTNHFVADGTISGPVGYKSGNPFSQASVTFSSLTDTTTGATDTIAPDPANHLPAVMVATPVGGVFVDQKQSIAAPGQSTSISGYISVPEMSTALSLGCLLMAGDFVRRGLRRRS